MIFEFVKRLTARVHGMAGAIRFKGMLLEDILGALNATERRCTVSGSMRLYVGKEPF